MVDVFRASNYLSEVVDEALAMNPRIEGDLAQLGVRDDAAAKAEAAGIKVVMDRCPAIEYPASSAEKGKFFAKRVSVETDGD